MDLRYDAHRQVIAQLMLLGWTAEKIAERIGRTSRAVRYAISTPEFQTLFNRLQQDQLKILDRKMSRLLPAAVKALFRMLKHPDWRARDAAAEKILKIHGRYIERIAVNGTLEHTGHVSHLHQAQLGVVPMDDMTDEQRRLARELLKATRPTHPGQPALPPATIDHAEQCATN